MIKKYFSVKDIIIGEGLITHHDREVKNLNFKISDELLTVIGAEGDIGEWSSRFSLNEIQEAEALVYLKDFKERSMLYSSVEIAPSQTFSGISPVIEPSIITSSTF